MALLGDDGRGYELARKLESNGVWRTWLGDSLYSNFVHFLSSPSTWDAFMRADSAVDSAASRAQLHLQLRARALLFDKASVSLLIGSKIPQPLSSSSPSPSSIAISRLNPNYLQLHGDDVYYTLEEAAQLPESVLAAANAATSKNKSSFAVGSRFGESETGSIAQRFKFDELPETWYTQFFEKYRSSKSYRLSSGDQETEKRTPEQMFTYIRVAQKHKRKRVTFKYDQNAGTGIPILENGSNGLSTALVDNSSALDDETPFFPETMFTMNCVPESAVLQKRRMQSKQKVEFNGVLDTLPQIVTKSPRPIMIERLGIGAEYLNMDPLGNQTRGRSGNDTRQEHIGPEQASQLAQKVIARFLSKVGFEGSLEVPLQVLSQLLSCHVCKLGRTLKLLADSYRKQCSATELLKMFLHTSGYNNLGVLSEVVKETSTRNTITHAQQMQAVQLHFQSQHQGTIRPSQLQSTIPQPQQMTRQFQLQLMNSQNMALQSQQQMERMKRRQQQQQMALRPGMNMAVDKDRPMVEVKLENPSEIPMDSNTIAAMAARQSQLQQFRQQQQQQLAALSFHAQTSNQIRPMPSLQIPPVQSPTMGMARAPPVKVEGFQELMGGDATLKHESEDKLTSPGK